MSFAAAGSLRLSMRFPGLPTAPAPSMLRELREGWHEFTSRRWLWTIVTQFAFIVAIYAATINVLGPLVADAHLGGARSWGFILAAYGGGAVAGGLIMIKFRPRRILVAAITAVPALSVLLFALAVPLSVPLDMAAAILAGGCLEVLSVSWATTIAAGNTARKALPRVVLRRPRQLRPDPRRDRHRRTACPRLRRSFRPGCRRRARGDPSSPGLARS